MGKMLAFTREIFKEKVKVHYLYSGRFSDFEYLLLTPHYLKLLWMPPYRLTQSITSNNKLTNPNSSHQRGGTEIPS